MIHKIAKTKIVKNEKKLNIKIKRKLKIIINELKIKIKI